ncbi:MAG: acyltransferase [Nanoarchaeota archaeon]
MIHKTAEVEEGSVIGENTKIWHHCHVRKGAKIGSNCSLGKGVYIDHDVVIGNNVKIQNNVSVYYKTLIEDGVMLGPHVCFTNDKFHRAINPDGSLKTDGSTGEDWEIGEILIKKGASIGANSTLLTGVKIGEFALIGAGSVVTKDVPAFGLVYGVPARLKGYVCKCGRKVGGADLKGKTKCSYCGSEIEIK